MAAGIIIIHIGVRIDRTRTKYKVPRSLYTDRMMFCQLIIRTESCRCRIPLVCICGLAVEEFPVLLPFTAVIQIRMTEVMAVIPIDIPFPRSIVERRLQILLRIEPISRPDIHHHLEASLSPFFQNNIQDTARTGRIVLCRCIRHDFDLLDIRRRCRFKQIYDFCLLHIRWFAIQ